MIIVIGETIYDSEACPIVVAFSQEEVQVAKKLGGKRNIISSSPDYFPRDIIKSMVDASIQYIDAINKATA